MAITAAITVSPDGVPIGRESVATLVISNSGAAAVVNGISPYVMPYNALSKQIAPAVVGMPSPTGFLTIPASGATTVKFGVMVLAPTMEGAKDYFGQYKVGAVIVLSTGAYVVPTEAILCCSTSRNTHEAARVWFDRFECSGMLAALI
jgi:hypothetical protein